MCEYAWAPPRRRSKDAHGRQSFMTHGARRSHHTDRFRCIGLRRHPHTDTAPLTGLLLRYEMPHEPHSEETLTLVTRSDGASITHAAAGTQSPISAGSALRAPSDCLGVIRRSPRYGSGLTICHSAPGTKSKLDSGHSDRFFHFAVLPSLQSVFGVTLLRATVGIDGSGD
jgi:hypothetical protein